MINRIDIDKKLIFYININNFIINLILASSIFV